MKRLTFFEKIKCKITWKLKEFILNINAPKVYKFNQLSGEAKRTAIRLYEIHYHNVQEKLDWTPRLQISHNDLIGFIYENEKRKTNYFHKSGLFNKDGSFYEI